MAGSELWVDCQRNPADCNGAMGTQANPYCTVTEAVAAASVGATVHLAAGLCQEKVVVDLADLEVVGAPGSATLIRSASSPVVSVVGVGGVALRDLVIEMEGDKGLMLDGAEDSAVSGVVVRQAGQATDHLDRKGIVLLGGDYRLVQVEVGPIGSTAVGAQVTGIKLDSGYGGYLESCSVHGLEGAQEATVIGIKATDTSEVWLEGCEVWDLTASGQYEIRGISLSSSPSFRMEHSSVHDLIPGACQEENTCTVIGVRVSDSQGFTTYRNRISHLGPEGTQRIAGYWLTSLSPVAATLRKDLIHDLASAAEQVCNTCGIRIEAGVTAEILNPTIARIGLESQSVTNTGVYAPSAPERNAIHNAILSDIKGYGLRAASANTLACTYTAFDNCTSGPWYGTSCQDHLLLIDDDPHFVDPSNGDFRLQASSPCIDEGDPNSACDQEPDCPVNLGAYGNTDEAAPRE